MSRHPMLDGYEGESVFIPQDWTPSIGNINALPVPLRMYIHDLQTNVDPAGTMRENVLLKDQVEALTIKLHQVLSGAAD